MTGTLAFLSELRDIVPCSVGLPNGEKTLAVKEGTVLLGGDLKLQRVLYVPNLNCNLISVSQLLNDSNLVIQLTNKICAIQDLNSRNLIGAGEQREGLYFLKGVTSVHACKVPSMEHDNEVKGESLDLVKYIDSNFDGPSLFPDDPAKKELAEELFAYTDSFNKALVSLFKGDANEAGTALDFIETSLSKYNDGPFFLGQFSLVDIVYAPFIERFQPALLDVRKYDITEGRPNLAAWIEEMNKIEAYDQTRRDPKEMLKPARNAFWLISEVCCCHEV
ncbi:protein IN2-1 homolog B isoform X2 [Hevea brasiliensis]|uniref:protein IN2-1 homolog B isoform X2 n=1 Tax=Hevea brasiliensis TaxID=3981 RepID=UPI0025EF5382|nr:protein IN2-1 homolog B isoform X2 [Hevea brasiliensis]